MKSQHCNDTQYQFSFFFDCRKKNLTVCVQQQNLKTVSKPFTETKTSLSVTFSLSQTLLFLFSLRLLQQPELRSIFVLARAE